ncbi:hypothetical protein M3P21_16075 [Ruegeria sp. 2012CJ41-6]|uniref:Chitin-binding type-2 domain-containing protein n=1 Tax=Ruegeria spongiae TaxID=2942209 RepID=A0ABT0Q5F6_9RHOB|nr:hypothetical protein [Ruegeria spongiae]MCL6285050.1 hypothetical protein [Ruegeria spongiae]
MKIKIFLAATLLSIAPNLALAIGCSFREDPRAMLCADGTTWDANSRTCITNES